MSWIMKIICLCDDLAIFFWRTCVHSQMILCRTPASKSDSLFPTYRKWLRLSPVRQEEEQNDEAAEEEQEREENNSCSDGVLQGVGRMLSPVGPRENSGPTSAPVKSWRALLPKAS